jgi:hypothetical protein
MFVKISLMWTFCVGLCAMSEVLGTVDGLTLRERGSPSLLLYFQTIGRSWNRGMIERAMSLPPACFLA